MWHRLLGVRVEASRTYEFKDDETLDRMSDDELDAETVRVARLLMEAH